MYKDNQDRIDAYLRGEMDTESRVQFEKALESDMTLKEEFNVTKAISEAIADRKKKLEMMALWDKEEEHRQKLISKKVVLRRWTIGLSAAACVAIGFFAIRPKFTNTSVNYVQPTFTMPDFGEEIYYRGGDNSLVYLDSLIRVKEYERAMVCVDSLIQDYNNELMIYEGKDTLTEKDFYNKEQCEVSLEDFEWRRANLLVALGKTNEAKQCLKRIIATNGIFKEQADSLLISLSED